MTSRGSASAARAGRSRLGSAFFSINSVGQKLQNGMHRAPQCPLYWSSSWCRERGESRCM